MEPTIIVSINVHENLSFLEKQIENIKTHLLLPHKIILNCSVAFHKELQERKAFIRNENVILNPEPLNKKRYHGSILQGIYSNLKGARKNYSFDYFLVLSSRTFFYRDFKISDIQQLPKRESFKTIKNIKKSKKMKRFSSFLQTKLAQHIKKNQPERFVACAHEGLFFDSQNCDTICDFLENNKKIREELFQWKWCIEEFALQTICMFKDGYYYNIGRGLQIYNLENIPYEEKHINKYVCKIQRK